jgi:hypothetical protein
MNAKRKITLRLTALALVATTSYVMSSAGCGGTTNSNPMPTLHDSGTDSTTGHPDAGHPRDGGGPTDTGVVDSPGIPDTGSCKSDSSACNSCYTDAQAASDPLNACSEYAKNCVSFDPTRVPTHPTL